ncbi:hypothetical protein R5W24_002285 [Gemmata sp. JC717]|uniref:hypothetical protein n=1 Tax=Gemmata algarum TaxID=2975278 RepID=UPI0021BB279A|nr:hypothetical protein [Gemmata algarum]MDY3553193.1 hypothetical protein [Gemmata algarum]
MVRGCEEEPVTVVLVRDPKGVWRDEVLLATGEVSAEFAVSGYCRRWSIEAAFHDSKPFVGLHDPQVQCGTSVERAQPDVVVRAERQRAVVCGGG